MENASKALIIAGAILLSILIIGLGMMIFNQAKDAMDDTGLDQQKISTYNADFDPYIGERISGANVRTLVNVVKNHNAAVIKADTTAIADANPEIITLTVDGTTATEVGQFDTAKSKVKTGKMYNVVATYNDSGLISTITATAI